MGKEEINLSLFAGDMIRVYPKDVTKKLLELINAGFKINTQKSALLYINNKLSEREIKETIPVTITSKTIKYLEINLTK